MAPEFSPADDMMPVTNTFSFEPIRLEETDHCDKRALVLEYLQRLD